MSSFTSRSGGASELVIILKPFALTFSTAARMFGTEKPMWLAVVPLEPPVGALAKKKIRTFGNLTISALFVPIFIAVPPSALTKNRFCSSTLAVLMW